MAAFSHEPRHPCVSKVQQSGAFGAAARARAEGLTLIAFRRTWLQPGGFVRQIRYDTAEMTPGELLRSARRRHGLSQQQLAARARTSQAAISRIERNLVSPSVATLASLLDLMGEELKLAAEPIDYGHDRTLIRANLEKSVAQRLDDAATMARFVRDLQSATRA